MVMRLRFYGYHGNRPSKLKEAIKVTKGASKVLFALLFRVSKSDAKAVVFEHGTDIVSRTTFLKENLQWNTADLIYFDDTERRYFYVKSYSVLRHAMTVLLIACLTLFKLIEVFTDKSGRDNVWFTAFLSNLGQVGLARKEFEFMFFQLFSPSTYFSAVFADKFGADYTVSLSNSILFSDNIYTILPLAKGLDCNVLHSEEIKNYEKRGWWNVGNITRVTNEDIHYLSQVPVKEKADYDIGIYTGGFWARDEHGVRLPTPMLRGMTKFDNKLYNVFLNNVLGPIIDFKKSHQTLSVIVFLHPFERWLIREHGINPPFASELEAVGVELDSTEKSSISRIYDCSMGISLQSTMISDRINMGLGGVFLSNRNESGKRVHEFLDDQYLGRYTRNTYKSGAELKAVLMRELEKKPSA